MTIPFTDLYGKNLLLPVEKAVFRPSVYGLIVHEGNLLVCNTKSTGKYGLPGGGIDLGEPILTALKREIFEEAGIDVEIGPFSHFEERFFYYNPSDQGWHAHAFFYFCTPKTFALSVNDPHELEAEEPHWVPIEGLREENFQAFGESVLAALGK